MKKPYDFVYTNKEIAHLMDLQEKINKSVGSLWGQENNQRLLAAISAIPRIEVPKLELSECFRMLSSPTTNYLIEVLGPLNTINANLYNIINSSFGVLKNIQSELTAVSSTLTNWINLTQFESHFEFFERFINLPQWDYEEYKKRYLQELYKAEWFPAVGFNGDWSLLIDLNDAVAFTQNEKTKKKKIDLIILQYYSKKRIDMMRGAWWKSDLPYPIRRIMSQAIKAYHRDEWAIVSITLSTLWQTIIFEKAKDCTSGHKTNNTKIHYKELIAENDREKEFEEFFDHFLMGDCRKKEDIIESIPNRNGHAHGWYNKYPNQKSALNAILFTDFLVNLNPLTNIEASTL